MPPKPSAAKPTRRVRKPKGDPAAIAQAQKVASMRQQVHAKQPGSSQNPIEVVDGVTNPPQEAPKAKRRRAQDARVDLRALPKAQYAPTAGAHGPDQQVSTSDLLDFCTSYLTHNFCREAHHTTPN